MTPPDLSLSPAGQQRREQILQLAQGAACRRRRQRRVGGLSVVAAGTLALALVWSIYRVPPARIAVAPPPPTPAPEFAVVGPATLRPRLANVVITRIPTDPTLRRRLALRPQPPTWRRLSDDALLECLADAGEPAGLARIQGKPVLLYLARLHR